MMVGGGWNDTDLVFCRVNGDPLHPDHFSREFVRRVARWGYPKLSLHGLRHTWATLALMAGVHPKIVQERSGHSTIAVTHDMYSHVTAGMPADAAATVADLMRSSVTNP